MSKITDMEKLKVYEFGSVPLKEAFWFVDGGKYVTSSGDVLKWGEVAQDFTHSVDSPLDLTLENNIVENLTEVQLKLFWKLCK